MKPRYKGIHRSGFEDKVSADLTKRKIPFEYEKLKLSYFKQICPHCHEPIATNTYTPDFTITRQNGILLILECKGFFDSTDRKKMESVKRDNPLLDIRLLFQRDQPIRKGSKTNYSHWAKKHGYLCSFGTSIPQSWLEE